MKPKKYKVMIDIYKGVLNNQLIEFTTQDHGSNVLEFEILEDKVTPYNLDGCLVRMVINGQQQDCTIADATNGLVNITLHQSMFSEVGPVFAELQIYDALNQTIRLTTPIFKYTVKKSLMDDETVQADPNYSILQNMILEVSSADEVAKQAKKTAESAMATANQAESKANQIMSNGDYAKEQGDYAKAEGDRLQGMLTLGGAPQTKFDFIKNKVVQDGLVLLEKNIKKENGTSNGYRKTLEKTSEIDILLNFSNISCNGSSATRTILSTDAFTIWFTSDLGTDIRFEVINKDGTKIQSAATPLSVKKLRILKRLNSVMLYNDDKLIHQLDGSDLKDITSITLGKSISGMNATIKFICDYLIVHNTILTPKEIQHNISVVDNQESIKELHTTNAEDETSILKLASDTDHVEDRSGRTQEQINRTFYKRMCKEIPSPSGEPITVKNGEEGYVLSAEIKGNTQLFKRAKGSQDEWIVIPNDEGRDTVAFEYKLDSTQAIISNNGETYPIYANEEDKANKKVISLNKMGDVSDSLEIKKDGSGVYTSEMMTVEVDKDSISLNSSAQNQILTKYFAITLEQEWLNENKLLSNLFPTTPIWNNDVEGCFLLGGNKLVMGFRILKSKLISDDLDGVKDYLTKNKLTAIYRTKAPTVTHIDKSIMPTILTQQTNILEVGGAVKPSSFKVTLPVDRIAELTARLEAVEAKTNTQPVNTAFVDETYAKSVNKIEEVIK